jgi:hypothetical protein
MESPRSASQTENNQNWIPVDEYTLKGPAPTMLFLPGGTSTLPAESADEVKLQHQALPERKAPYMTALCDLNGTVCRHQTQR